MLPSLNEVIIIIPNAFLSYAHESQYFSAVLICCVQKLWIVTFDHSIPQCMQCPKIRSLSHLHNWAKTWICLTGDLHITLISRFVSQSQITNYHRTANFSGDFDTIVWAPHGRPFSFETPSGAFSWFS